MTRKRHKVQSIYLRGVVGEGHGEDRALFGSWSLALWVEVAIAHNGKPECGFTHKE